MVAPLLKDSFTVAMVLLELSQIASIANLKRKEAFYKYLAFKKIRDRDSQLS